jgi:hypothetical protein
MKTVVSYLKGVPNAKNKEKIDVLHKFVQGVNLCGDNGIVHDKDSWIISDLAVIQGYVHQGSPAKGHLKLRQTILRKQKNTTNTH